MILVYSAPIDTATIQPLYPGTSCWGTSWKRAVERPPEPGDQEICYDIMSARNDRESTPMIPHQYRTS